MSISLTISKMRKQKLLKITLWLAS